MLADFLTVIPQTRLLSLVTYRPEYRGELTQATGSQTISLAPLRDQETAALVEGIDAEVRLAVSGDEEAHCRARALARLFRHRWAALTEEGTLTQRLTAPGNPGGQGLNWRT